MQDFRIYAIHDHALTVAFSQKISEQDNLRVMALRSAIQQKPINGLLDIVPAYSSLTIYFDGNCEREEVMAYLKERILASLELQHEPIGRTPLKIFDAFREPSCLLKAGDQVKFASISLNEFNSLS
ncbi:MAG: carboxyltransferase domain-containing protein [Chitinophagia bacterium]|nr:carboxyltransferase domain-containing protein [Chitinophagia bacterium]